ncbi:MULTISPECIES: hypothetical protein [unclassified Duganella]|uniref:hypothetical protein n=1 Tax=unclassified Duganella TaxID=2636909 RepID=UPI0007003858|nr:MULTISPECIES: hypothetical protein [unclassified Duganella]KQV59054.1 hypothetical protein ASD07_25800 [Duganella sp. Root336D2]KRB93423.1 hypothetical protein ASE26_28185 [Duganella sp. Root198D2]
MIQFYCVQLLGEPFLLDGEEFGFYRNEYVLALSEERAIDVAKIKTMKRLESVMPQFIDGQPFVLKVESIKTGMQPWRLLRNEGFLFFPANDQDEIAS